MVNTFIVADDVQDSVALLDTRRLGKQRVEAQQILNILLDAQAIAIHFQWDPQPRQPGLEGDILREQWLREVYRRYKSQSVRLFCNDGEKYGTLSPSGRKVNGGFSSHPMVAMWVGYEDGLRYYINATIIEWIHRGKVNNMRFHILYEMPQFPWWTKNKALQYSHQSALLRKEKVRKEKRWYWTINDWSHVLDTGVPGEVPGGWYRCGYLWISRLTLTERQLLLSSSATEKEMQKLCYPIMNDFDDM